ncbi:MAG: HlyD family secretion protein [bacterium]
MTDQTAEEKGAEAGEKPAMTIGKKAFLVLFLIVLIVFAVIAVKWFHYRFTHAITDNAFVESDLINVAPLVSGYINKIHVQEGDQIEKGKLLVEINATDYRNQAALQEANVRAAESNLNRSLAALENLRVASREQIRRAESQLTAARADADQVQKDYDRIHGLLQSGAVSKSRYDVMEAARIGVRSKVAAAEADLRQARASSYQVKEAESAVEAMRSALKAAEEGLNVARTSLGYTRIESPVQGVVAKKFMNQGDFISAGYPVLSVYDKGSVYVTANLEETKTEGVKAGHNVDLNVDTYGGKTFHGKVILVGEAAGAKFALIPRDNSAGEFTKVVQRIPIKISVEEKDKGLLKPGMSVTVGIELNDGRKKAAEAKE